MVFKLIESGAAISRMESNKKKLVFTEMMVLLNCRTYSLPLDSIRGPYAKSAKYEWVITEVNRNGRIVSKPILLEEFIVTV